MRLPLHRSGSSLSFFGATDPIGQLVQVLPEPQYPARTYQIVGTVADTKYNGVREAKSDPEAFVPIDQVPETAQGPFAAIMIASENGPATVAAVRRTIAARYPEMILQFFDFQGIRDNLVGDGMMAMLSGCFGVLAALLVVIGLYGVLSYFIMQRQNEIGIRVALGADRGRVIGLVMRDTAVMLAIGVVLGAILALVSGRAANSMLFGYKAYDAATLAFAVLLATIAVAASLVPALRASRLDPMVALRCE